MKVAAALEAQVPESSWKRANASRKQLAKLSEEIGATPAQDGASDLLEPDEVLYPSGGIEQAPWCVRRGSFEASLSNKPLFEYETGDIIFPEPAGGTHHLVLRALEQCEVQRLVPPRELPGSQRRALQDIAALQLAIIGSIASRLLYQDQLNLQTRLAMFAPGHIILQQQTSGDELYVLRDGSAVTMLDGVPVGEIRPGDVFGAAAAFSNSPRRTSVIADEASSAFRYRREEVPDLMHDHPGSVRTMLSRMARAVVNEQQSRFGEPELE
ncbi:MAG: cyclic nucleotide-binding domain-containing protein [Bdellovibrionales bacterium]|nr:cyclic nucleotide-binding domain-containing protein [Bdellovibrionales bacterium]